MTLLTPLFGSMEGFGDGLLICMLLPIALVLLLLFVWWGILGMFFKERRDTRLDRARAAADPVAPPRTIGEVIDIVHKNAVAEILGSYIQDLLKSGDPEVRKAHVRRVVEHLFDNETPLVNRLEREEAIKVVVDRILGPRPE